jgi:hypothetical protein
MDVGSIFFLFPHQTTDFADRLRLRGKGSISPDRSQVGDVEVEVLGRSDSRSGAELEKVDTRPEH